MSHLSIFHFTECDFLNLRSTESRNKMSIPLNSKTSTTDKAKPANMIRAIERVMRVLDVLSKYSKGISLGDLAAAVNLPKGTVHRLLASLYFFDVVRQDSETRKYSLGFKLVELASILLDQIDIRREAEPFLVDLSFKTKETVYLVILDRTEVVYIERIEPDDPNVGLKATSKVGQRNAANSCSVGKVLLAYLSQHVLEETLKDMPFLQKTENTITDPLQLKDHLQGVRSRGYAIDDEESEKGIRCVAAPIFKESGKAIAAISISGPAIRVTRQCIQDVFKDELMKTAMQISRKLGYRG
jgi:DNA-binding IclR family transcriptional regulator